jgi:2-polyprenyl-3-methyl-5-hydroxy-6-metoxy-1,4-benzoquinol methylase
VISVITNNPIALNSLDHIYPEGVHYDNNVTQEFIEELEFTFKRKINFLDLGCAGGNLVCEMHKQGHKAVGLEGSDHCLNPNKEKIEALGSNPRGYDNWIQYGNKILFTCDVTKDFTIIENGKPLIFDAITCFDVMEHFEPDEVDNFVKNVYNHLSPYGIFFASIALYSSSSTKNCWEKEIDYHRSNFPESWWNEKLSKYLVQIPFPLLITNRGIPENTYICSWVKKE